MTLIVTLEYKISIQIKTNKIISLKKNRENLADRHYDFNVHIFL